MIQAYRSIQIPIETDDGLLEVTVPLTLGLMKEMETVYDELDKANNLFVFRKFHRMAQAFRSFAEPYLPRSLDRERIQPAVYAFFFEYATSILIGSLGTFLVSTQSMETPAAPTASDPTTTEPT